MLDKASFETKTKIIDLAALIVKRMYVLNKSEVEMTTPGAFFNLIPSNVSNHEETYLQVC